MFNFSRKSLLGDFGTRNDKQGQQSFGNQTAFGQGQNQAQSRQTNTKPTPPVIPMGDTVDERLKSMQGHPLYRDPNDTRLHDHVTQEYQRAYPGTAQYDAFGKMKRPQPSISPEQVRAFDPDGMTSTKPQNTAQRVRAQIQAGQDALSEGNDMSDADLKASGVPTMEDMASFKMTPTEARLRAAAQNAAAAKTQTATGRYTEEDAEDLHDIDLHAMGEETMDDIVASSMTREEAARKAAQENQAAAQRQATTGEEAREAANDLPDDAIRDVVDSDKGSPLPQAELQEVREKTAFAKTVRDGMGGTDFNRKKGTMDNMSNWKRNNRKAYEDAGPEAQHLHSVYERYRAEALTQGYSMEEAEHIAMRQTDDYGAAMYSPVIAVDQVRGAANELITGAGLLTGKGVDVGAYNNVMKPTLQPGYANSERGQSIKKGAQFVTDTAIAALPMKAGALVDGLRATARGAHQVAQEHGDFSAQLTAGLTRGGASVATGLFANKSLNNVGASAVKSGVKQTARNTTKQRIAEKAGKAVVSVSTGNMADQAAASGIDTAWRRENKRKKNTGR